jgi:hypothetical protein
MAEWIDDLATSLHVTALTPDEVEHILAAAREVAHRVERRLTPLATFLAGMNAGQLRADGMQHHEAVMAAITALQGQLPHHEPDISP